MDPFPDDLKRFIDGYVETVDQLEILRAVTDRPAGAWDAAVLAREAEVDGAAVGAELAALHARGLLAAEPRDGGTVYRSGPATPELAGLVGRLVRLYAERPVSVIRAIYARPKGAVRSLADAFRLRREI